MPDIKRLVSECRKHFEILIPRTQTPLIVRTQTPLITRTQTPLIIRTQTPVYTNDRLKDLAKGWERPYELFKGCLVLVEPTSGFKSYIEIEGGFDRYPKTASLLEGHLQDLERMLLETVDLLGGGSRKELQKLQDSMIGSLVVLHEMVQVVCPQRDTITYKYHDHCLAAKERGLNRTFQYR
ncbi:MAG: hypothetical protein HETSPECPRED_002009 [Heterodermia speciosa]|uniref:Uncharacterized protein n=1 Tax=Heterodermia speciosa TaxID=116794 RepID=A0A8H3EW18_9LECA|nr:MAG: hypothetical protein HETSPECPRED_002009 [Heterodermia speciosa]